MAHLAFNSPLGPLTLFEDDGALVALEWGWGDDCAETPLLTEAQAQLDAYFDRRLRTFDLPFAPQGTAFQRRVWEALATIPYGETRTYGTLARDLDSGPRAIGGACGRNPLPILIPCHRVLAGNGGLGGYSGDEGVETKRRLLRLEGVTV